jgi:L-lactate utilization protein LutB
MEKATEQYWDVRLPRVIQALEANNFEAFLASDVAEARHIVLHQILQNTGARSLSWGGSRTVMDIGLIQAIEERPDIEFLNPFEKDISLEESIERRRHSLMVDLFITGTNAVTETGQLVNLDRTGNRVAAITFGPKFVVILVGRNKIAADLDEAMYRIKDLAAPLVAMWLNVKVPCTKTSHCEDCKSPERVCSAWGIIEKSYPKARIKVVLINEDLGF